MSMNGWNAAERLPVADFEQSPLPGPEAAIERAALPVAAGEMGPLPAAPWLAEPVRSDPRVRRTPAPAETPKRRWNRPSAREQERVQWNTPDGQEEARGRVKRVVVKADPRVRWIPPAGQKEAPRGPLATPPEAPLFDVPGPYEVNVREFGAIGSKLQFVGSIEGELDLVRIRVDKVRVRVEADSPPERPADSSDDPYLQERLGKPGHFDKPIHADQWVLRDAPAQVAAFRQLRPGAGIGIFGAAAKGVSHAAVIVAVDAAKFTVKFKPAAATRVTDAEVWNDDRPPIQAALDEAGLVAGVKNLRGAVVRVPAGTYPIGVPWAADNRPVFVWSNTRVVGEGPQRTVLVLADEVNQPVWDPQNPGNNLWAKVKSAGTAMVVANSRSTSWARDHRDRFHESVVRGSVDYLGPADREAAPNENISLEELAVDGNRENQRRLYRGGGDRRSWSYILREPREELPSGVGRDLVRQVPGIESGSQSVDFVASDNGSVPGMTKPVAQTIYVLATLIDGDGNESTPSRMGVILLYDLRRSFSLRVLFGKYPNVGRARAGNLKLRIWVRDGRPNESEAAKQVGYRIGAEQVVGQLMRKPIANWWDPREEYVDVRVELDPRKGGPQVLGEGPGAAPPGFGITAAGQGAGAGITLDNVRGSGLLNVVIRDCAVDGLMFGSSQSDPNDKQKINGGAEDCWATKVRMERCGRWGAAVPGRARNLRFSWCEFVDNLGGIDVEGHFEGAVRHVLGHVLRWQSRRFPVDGLYFDDCTWLNVGGFGIKLGPSPGQLMRLLRVQRCRFAGQAVAIWLAAENRDSLIDDVEITDTFFCFTLKQACVIQTRGEPAFPGKWLYPTGGRGRLYRCRFYHCPTGGLREPSYSYDASHIHPVLSFVATRRLKDEPPAGLGRWRNAPS